MTFFLGLWLIAAVAEFTLYRALPVGRSSRLYAWSVIGLLLIGSTGLLIFRWPVWLGMWCLGAYRAINICRYISGRLPITQIKKVSLRAFGWLLGVQIGVTAAAWLVADHKWGGQLLALFVTLQLVMALTLLRSTWLTWRYTRPIVEEGMGLSDKDMPTLSVLVPARNETTALEECLQALVASDYPKLEIIVYDDCSANRRTPEIIRAFAQDGVRFIQGAAPDETRWLAKNQAYDNLRKEASGELLLFCGVDVIFGSQSLRQLVNMLLAKNRDMISVLPLRDRRLASYPSLLQPMRYFWELCLPRRLFKRPPVLSTCWLIRAAVLDRVGGFGAVARSIVPEAHFARQAVISDKYGFVRGDEVLGVYSTKPLNEQYATTVRMRYPQLHRRLELVALTAMVELAFLLGPIIGLCFVSLTVAPVFFTELWVIALLLLLAVYYFVAARTKLNSAWNWWWLYPFAVVADIALLHISMWKYEFGSVEWKGRNVCIPVMQLQDRS